jgi:hypothetical protein
MVGLFGATAMTVSAAQPAAEQSEAASPEHRPVRFVGIVADVGERGVLMRTLHGPVFVAVGDHTLIHVPDDGECVEGELADLVEGERAHVVGWLGRHHVVLARAVSQCRPGGDTIE